MTLPRPLPRLFSRLPLPPLAAPALGLALTRLLRRIATRQPAILSRLGPYQAARFLIDVQDGPVLLLMEPEARRITALPRRAPPPHDAAIRGRMAAFLAMLHGTEDGDALFFSGELEISGDTSAVLALRNALDDAELDLTGELAALARPPFDRWLRRASHLAAQRSGYALSREEPLA
ncbi:ubiquinone anaerobic biosynthesis accessory factor UbiT [Pseudogemmobacter humi]|uniref:SCP-2 sterol transfer family protein n=1 Tax=Pseudogemmobacter humi TaxID=2483812 RepID=A0A3P5WE19_9RHOB|nr:SCP2 sterol-binding domain-containing protein [Pseudogemmobacter humi]VDC19918.1 SCP-2 sterol transfer family protein [Pseudogemmobacter humi]